MCLVKLSSVGLGVCHHQPNLLSVHVMVAILEVLIKVGPRDVRVFVHARSRMGMSVCMCLPFPVSTRQLLVCVCMYMYVQLTPLNNSDYIRPSS